jgi:hypothetical protein
MILVFEPSAIHFIPFPPHNPGLSEKDSMMTQPSASLLCVIMILLSLLTGCLTQPVASSGGIGSVTVRNSNSGAIIAAAQNVFPQYGYTPAFGGDGISSVSFDKNSNQLANILWGSYGDPQTIRVKVKIVPIPGTNDYRISPKVYTVSDRGEAGFESKRALIGLWGSEFGPLLKKVAAQASDSGAQ